MLLTKEQISEQMRKHAENKNGLHNLMEIMRSHVDGGLLLSRARFLVRLHFKINIL